MAPLRQGRELGIVRREKVEGKEEERATGCSRGNGKFVRLLGLHVWRRGVACGRRPEGWCLENKTAHQRKLKSEEREE